MFYSNPRYKYTTTKTMYDIHTHSSSRVVGQDHVHIINKNSYIYIVFVSNYSGTLFIWAAWGKRVPVTSKVPVTPNVTNSGLYHSVSVTVN